MSAIVQRRIKPEEQARFEDNEKNKAIFKGVSQVTCFVNQRNSIDKKRIDHVRVKFATDAAFAGFEKQFNLRFPDFWKPYATHYAWGNNAIDVYADENNIVSHFHEEPGSNLWAKILHTCQFIQHPCIREKAAVRIVGLDSDGIDLAKQTPVQDTFIHKISGRRI